MTELFTKEPCFLELFISLLERCMALGFFLSFLFFLSITFFVFARNLRSAVTFTTLFIFCIKTLFLFITLVYFLVVCLNLP